MSKPLSLSMLAEQTLSLVLQMQENGETMWCPEIALAFELDGFRDSMRRSFYSYVERRLHGTIAGCRYGTYGVEYHVLVRPEDLDLHTLSRKNGLAARVRVVRVGRVGRLASRKGVGNLYWVNLLSEAPNVRKAFEDFCVESGIIIVGNPPEDQCTVTIQTTEPEKVLRFPLVQDVTGQSRLYLSERW